MLRVVRARRQAWLLLKSGIIGGRVELASVCEDKDYGLLLRATSSLGPDITFLGHVETSGSARSVGSLSICPW